MSSPGAVEETLVNLMVLAPFKHVFIRGPWELLQLFFFKVCQSKLVDTFLHWKNSLGFRRVKLILL